MRASGDGRLAAGTLAVILALAAVPAAAQDGPVGPCSPYGATDGDIPSEMPGCARRLRPAPGSLADEMEFRRARKAGAAETVEPYDDDPLPVPRGKRAKRP